MTFEKGLPSQVSYIICIIVDPFGTQVGKGTPGPLLLLQ